MNNLSPRQRVKLNAALAIIHDSGHDAKAIGRAAQADIARGLSHKSSYDRALTEFSKGKPELHRALAHTLRLIDASDDATVQRYGVALDEYNQTGNPQAMAPVAQTFVQDSIALAVRNGEISREDAGNPEAVQAAFGFPFGEGAGERIIAMAGISSGTPAQAPQQAPQGQAPAAPAPRQDQTGWTARAQFQEERRQAAAQAAPASPPAGRPGSFQPINGTENARQGWVESNVYG